MKSRRPVNSAVMRRASFVEMTELQPHETTVTGNWLIDGTTVIGDDACRRIEWLVDTQLERLATGSSGWETLYRDPRTVGFGSALIRMVKCKAADHRN